MNRIIIRKGRESSLLRHHPWIFSGAVDRVEGNPGQGTTVEILSHDRRWLARAAYSPASQIRARIWTFREEEAIDQDFFRRRIVQASMRRKLLEPQIDTDGYRLIYGESDGIPGLIADHWAGYLVCQFLSAGAEYWKSAIIGALQQIVGPKGIFERSEAEVRKKEGLAPATGLLAGEELPGQIRIREGRLSFLVDPFKGHKTGFYADQRENRRAVMAYSTARTVLDAFSYTGGFGVAALAAGAANVVNIDTSADALELGQANFMLNGLDANAVTDICGDVFRELRTFREEGRKFDLVILDPPKFVSSAAQLQRGARGYKDINMVALQVLSPGGVLFTFSCSGYVDPALFQKIVADAALDAGRKIQFVSHLFQGPDHPVAGEFPEGLYLKGLVCLAE